MGKGKRSRAARADYMAEQKEKRAAEKIKKKKTIKFSGIAAGAVALVVAISIGLSFWVGSTKDNGNYLRNKTAMSGGNITVDNAMMSYFFTDAYQSFVNNYGSYLQNFGLDTSKSLKSQTYGEQTWYDYFMDQAKSTVKMYVVLAQAADKAKVTLNETELASITSALENVDLKNYAKGIKKEDIEKSLKLSAIANKYRTILMEELDITEDDIKKHFDQNSKNYMTVSYYSYSFAYNDDSSTALSSSSAKSFATKLAACKTVDEYKKWLTDYIKSTDDSKKDSAIKEAVDKTLSESVSYTKDDAVSEWAFGKDAKVGSTYTKEDTSGKKYTVYMLAATPTTDESVTKNVRHILISRDSFESATKAHERADALLEEWTKGEKTENSFADLAIKYSQDPGSAAVGGLYQDVVEGQMVANFNDWCFDKERKAGDTQVVKTSYGYHIMYFIGDGNPAWKAKVKSDIQSELYNKKYTELTNANTVTVNDKIINKIPG